MADIKMANNMLKHILTIFNLMTNNLKFSPITENIVMLFSKNSMQLYFIFSATIALNLYL